jgi:hypothetical protein
MAEFRAAAARTANLRERQYLTIKAARLASEPGAGLAHHPGAGLAHHGAGPEQQAGA